MSGQSLGLIETVGLTVAVEAADAAIKSANVELVGYELTKGSGLVTIKLTGEVGAMNAAVSAGVAASRVGQVYAWKVIARTATGIDSLIASSQTCGTPPEPTAPAAECLPAAAEIL
jgi:microcompartment protein CcmL/EutN